MGTWTKTWTWLLAALLPLFALPCSAAATELSGPLASVDWLKKNLGRPDIVVVDASPPPVHAKGHIPGAVLSTLFTFGPHDPPVQSVQNHLRDWGVGPDHRIVLVDAGGTYFATRLFWDLVHRGLPAERLLILDGGMTKWLAEGGAVTQQATPKPPPGTVRLDTLNPDVRVRLPEFLAATADPRRHVMLEALEPSYFYGGAAFFNRGGHVPHATLMPSDDFYNADKTFKSPQEIQRMLDHLGVRRDQQVLTYCGGGGAAAVPFFVLKYLVGYPSVKLFHESQRGWLQDERELPVWTYADPHRVRGSDWLKAWANPMFKAFGLMQVSVVDVRSPEAFKLGHVPLAVNLPAQQWSQHRHNPAQLATLLGQAGVDPLHEAVVVSDGGLNEHSALALLLLESLGQKKVSILLDSTERWAELGNTVVRPNATASAAAATRPATAPVGAATAYAATPRSGVLISDPARSQGLYPKVYIASGAQPPERTPERAPEGRVVHLPYTQLLNADGAPRPAHEIWKLLDKAGVPRYGEIIAFADKPGEAAVNVVVLRMMGFADVKLWAP